MFQLNNIHVILYLFYMVDISEARDSTTSEKTGLVSGSCAQHNVINFCIGAGISAGISGLHPSQTYLKTACAYELK